MKSEEILPRIFNLLFFFILIGIYVQINFGMIGQNLIWGFAEIILAITIFKNSIAKFKIEIEKLIIISSLTSIPYSIFLGFNETKRNTIKQMFIESVNESALLGERKISIIEEQGIQTTIDIFTNISPFIHFFMLFSLMYLLFYIGLKTKGSIYAKGFLAMWKNPEWMIYILSILSAALLFMPSESNYFLIVLNLLLCTVSLYFVQGLSISKYFFIRMKNMWFLEILFYVTVFFLPITWIILIIIGLLDYKLEIRNMKR